MLGPLAFIAYIDDSTDVIQQHGAHSQSFADDMQLHASASTAADVSGVRQRLSQCSADVMNWCAASRLQLNADKTEELLVGSKNNLTTVSYTHLTLPTNREV